MPSRLHADERGSIVADSNASGDLIQTNTYDAFGVPGATNDGLFQYTGQIWLEDAGIYHYKNRAYHAELGVRMTLASLRAGHPHPCRPTPLSNAGG